MSVVWVDTKDVLTLPRVDADLRALVERRFGRLMLVHRGSSLQAGQLGSWLVFYPASPVFGGTVVLRRGGRRLAFRTEFGNDWSTWFLHVVSSELAALYKAECRGEGIEGSWSPDPRKWPRFEDFVRAAYRRSTEEALRSCLAEVPKALLEAVPSPGGSAHEDRGTDADGDRQGRRDDDHRDTYAERYAARRVAAARR